MLWYLKKVEIYSISDPPRLWLVFWFVDAKFIVNNLIYYDFCSKK